MLAESSADSPRFYDIDFRYLDFLEQHSENSFKKCYIPHERGLRIHGSTESAFLPQVAYLSIGLSRSARFADANFFPSDRKTERERERERGGGAIKAQH